VEQQAKINSVACIRGQDGCLPFAAFRDGNKFILVDIGDKEQIKK
jgi:hypothetical protein